MKRLAIALAALLATGFLGLLALDQLAPATATRWAVALERHRAHLTVHTTTIPGFTIAYTDSDPTNRTDTPLLLIHGSGGDKDNFTRLARHLHPHTRVIALDLPGYGDSSKPEHADYRIPAQVQRVAQFLSALALPRAHLAGNSMGGFIAAVTAAEFPQQVESLWLLAPAGVKTAPESEARRLFRETGRSPLFAETAADYPQVMAMVMARPPVLPPSIAKTLGARAQANYRLHTGIYAAQFADPFRLEDRMGGVGTPTLIVWGEQDRVLHPAGAEILHRLMPHARLHRLPGIGHVPMIEAPAVVAQQWLQWRGLAR